MQFSLPASRTKPRAQVKRFAFEASWNLVAQAHALGSPA
jgi:hypothetical protein